MASANWLVGVRYQINTAWNRMCDAFDWWFDADVFAETPFIAYTLMAFVGIIAFGVALKVVERFIK